MAKLTVPFNGGSGGKNADLESIKDRVDELEDDVEDLQDKMEIVYAGSNAYMEIKNSLGTIDILTSDWVENTGDTDYPYKWELTNGYLEGAVNCIVVYSKDSDTSMLSATTGIDEENGKLIIYASELPTATISIEKIAVFNDLNAYIAYSNEIVQQVLQNTSAISDINNTKLLLYLLKEVVSGNYKSKVESTGQNLAIRVSDNDTEKSGINLTKDGNITLVASTKIGIAPTSATGDIKGIEITPNGVYLRKIDEDLGTYYNEEIASKNDIPNLFTTSTDATESGGVYTLDVSGITGIEANDYIAYLNSGAFTTLYQVASITSGVATLNVVGSFGGGKQLYIHNIFLYGSTKGIRVRFQIINSEQTPYTLATLKDWFTSKGYTSNANQYWWVYGTVSDTNYTNISIPTGLYLDNQTIQCGYQYSPSGSTSSPISELIYDTVETL